MLRLLIPVLGLALTIYCLLDLALTDRHAVRKLSKVGWFAVVLLLPAVGAGLWLLFGRPGTDARLGRGEPTTPPPGGGEPPAPGGGGPDRGGRPLGPEDDPDFLRRLDERFRRGR
jgi:hypothetical protein